MIVLLYRSRNCLQNDNLDLANSSIVNATSLSATSLTIVDSTVTGGINASGVITASSFTGDGSGLTGVASTDNIITGTAATFNNTGGITANEIDVKDGNMIDNGLVLTYEDVTNIDSVGMVTARIGVRVLTGGINAVGVVCRYIIYRSFWYGSNLSGISYVGSYYRSRNCNCIITIR